MTRPFSLLAVLLLAAKLAFAGDPALTDQGAHDPRLKGYLTPPGFKVQLSADYPAVVNPVAMTFAEDGSLYVAEWVLGSKNDRIKRLRSTKGDGIFDEVGVALDGLTLPAGVLVHDGFLYLPQDQELWRLKLVNGKADLAGKRVLAAGFHNDNSHHRLSGISLGPDGWLYLSNGDSGADASGPDGHVATVHRSGGVYRCRLDGSGMEVVAFGMRNPYGNVAFDREFNIFHTDNDNEDGSKFQGCRLLHLVDEGDYGWRLRFGARCCQPDHPRATWFGERPGRLGRMLDTGRGAPTGVTVLNSPAFPPALQNSLIHPDVFRRLVRLFQVKPAGASFEVTSETPLLQVRGQDEGLFRPCDAEMGPDGALYILDWRTDSGGAGRTNGDDQHGRIYRVTWAGDATSPALPTTPLTAWSCLRQLDDSELLDVLRSSDAWERTYAQRELTRRAASGDTVIHAAVADLTLDNRAPLTARLHAIMAAALPWTAASQPLCERLILTPSESPVLRARALDLLSRFGQANPALLSSLKQLLQDQNAIVQRRAALAYGKLADPATVAAGYPSLYLPILAHGEDAFLVDGVYRALDHAGPAAVAKIRQAVAEGSPARRGLALQTLRSLRQPSNADALVDMITSDSVPLQDADRLGLLEALPAIANAQAPARLATWFDASPSLSPALLAAAVNDLTAIGDEFPDDVRAIAAPLLERILFATDSATQRAAIQFAERSHPDDASAQLAKLAASKPSSSEIRALAIAALKSFGPVGVAPVLEKILDSQPPENLQIEALRTLAKFSYKKATKRCEPLLTSPSPSLRSEAIRIVGQKTDGALQLLENAKTGSLVPGDLPVVLDAVGKQRDPRVQAAVATLLKERMAKQGADAATLVAAVNKRGKAERGRDLFLNATKLSCIQCHELEGTGGRIGPSLTKVYETLSLEKIIESILDPSKEIKEGYHTYVAELKDKRLVVGRMVSESPDTIVLFQATGEEARVPKNELLKLTKSNISQMPEGTTAALSLQEFADLLAFLKSKTVQESLRKK